MFKISLLNLTEEKWANISVPRCATQIEMYPKRLAVVITVKVDCKDSTGLETNACCTFPIIIFNQTENGVFFSFYFTARCIACKGVAMISIHFPILMLDMPGRLKGSE
ncbi:hypothetical protein XENORESO_019939 [Xenotaenia resolanae]|uniref:Uncharacterized protein n=1 Tax=Xenotaenia resolanae TaxID=208358 RepID=A0ABV0W5H2_9TELE